MFNIKKINESFIRVSSGDRSTEMDLKEYYTFKAPGYLFSPKYKAKLWNGDISLYNMGTKQLPSGLLMNLLNYFKNNKIEYTIDETLKDVLTDVSKEEIDKFVESLNCYSRGKPLEARDYQLECIYQSIRQKRLVSKVPTSGGKSFIIYCIMRWFLEQDLRYILIVPNVTLVTQMYSDFKDYSSHNGFDVEENVHTLYQGQAKEFQKPMLISTWQSLEAVKKKNPKIYEVLNTYDAVCVDECHLATGNALQGILGRMTDVAFRFGTTGTIDTKKINKLTIEANIGPVYSAITTKELIERGQVSDIDIRCLVLRYPEDECKVVKSLDYDNQTDYIITHAKRNSFVRKLALSTDGTTLILVSKVEKHAIPLYESLKEKSERPVYLIVGDVEGEVREQIRQMANKENCIIVASYGTMSTGVSIPNIRYVMFGSGSKSMIRVLQSIGRGLRLHEGKERMVLIDIVDNLSYKKKMNFAMNHFEERLKMYQQEQFNLTIKEIPL